MTAASLAYRNNQPAIWRGKAPEKYTRLLPYIAGKSVLEIGSAEGVLSLLLAERGHFVTALELREERHAEALRLQLQWLEMGRSVERCTLLMGDIRERLDLLKGVDTLVAVRSVYYLRESAPSVFAEIAKHVPNVVLCGNKNRAARFVEGDTSDNLGQFNFYASAAGMIELLAMAGYRIETVIKEGDPIVVARRP